MMSNRDRLAHMANQIARNFAISGEDAAVRATADHIASFWDPRMKTQAFAMLDADAQPFSPAAAAALRLLRAGATPEHTTRATEFVVGGSDAG